MKQGNDGYPLKDNFNRYCLCGEKENLLFNATQIEFYGVNDGPLENFIATADTIKLEIPTEESVK